MNFMLMLSQQRGVLCTISTCRSRSQLAAQQAALISTQGEACLQQQTTTDGKLSLQRGHVLACMQSLHHNCDAHGIQSICCVALV